MVFDCSFEGGHMVFLQTAGCGIHIPLACCIVGVKAVFTGAASRKMLDGHGNSLWRHAVFASLNARNQPLHDLGYQFGVLPEGTEGALPAGVCHHVRHIHISLFQSAGIPLTPHNIRKDVDNIQIAGPLHRRRNAQSARIGSEHTGSIVHSENSLPVFIPAVAHHLNRYETLAVLRKVL